MNPFAFLRRKPKVRAPKGAAKLGKMAGGARKGGPVEEEKSLPRLGIVGHTGSGKTVYLAILHDVCREGGEVVFQAYDDVTAAEILHQIESLRGAARRFLTSETAGPGKPSFPPPTTGIKQLTFETAVRNVERLQLTALEYPGASVSIYEEGSLKKQVNEWIEESDGILFLVDPATLASEADASSQVSSFRSLLARVSGPSGKRRVPVAIVVTKADQIEGFRDDTQTILIPHSFDRKRDVHVHHMIEEVLSQPEYQGNPQWRDSVRAVLNRLRELLPVMMEHDPGFQIYFVSSTGGIVKEEAGARPPDVLKPVGVREPLRWAILRIGAKLRVERRKRWAKKLAIGCAILAATVSLWNGLVWWWEAKTAPRRGAAVYETARGYGKFDRSLFMWFRFLTPQVGRASRDRAAYAGALALYERFPGVRSSADSVGMDEILRKLQKLQNGNPRARDDLKRLERILTARWDEARMQTIRKLAEAAGDRKRIEREIGLLLDPVRKGEARSLLDQAGSPLYFAVQQQLASLSANTYLIDGPLQSIKQACDDFLTNPASIGDLRRGQVISLKALVEEALASLAIPDPPASVAAIRNLRERAGTQFPQLSAFLALPRPGGPASGGGGGGGGDRPFEKWMAESTKRDPTYNLIKLPTLLRERVRTGLASSENLAKARAYLLEVAKWTDPGVALQLVITRQPRSGFHFHLGGPDGKPTLTEYEQNRPHEFRWRLDQPFVLYLSSNEECVDELRTMAEWRKTGTLAVFDAAEVAKEGFAEFQTPDGPFRVEFQILGLEQAIPILQ